MEFIKFEQFEDVDVLEEGVCGGKFCCIKVKWNGKDYKHPLYFLIWDLEW